MDDKIGKLDYSVTACYAGKCHILTASAWQTERSLGEAVRVAVMLYIQAHETYYSTTSMYTLLY